MSEPVSTHHRLIAFDRSSRALAYLAVAMGFFSALMAVVFACLLAVAVGEVFIDGHSLSGASTLLAAMVVVLLARGVAVGLGDVLAQRAACRLKGRLRDDLTAQVRALGPPFTKQERSGELVNAASQGVEDLDEYVTLYLPARFLGFLVPPMVALAVFAADPFSVLILLVTGPLVLVFLALIGSRAKAITERRYQELGWMSASFLDLLRGLPTLKMFGRSAEQVETIREVSRRYGKTTMEVLRTAFETAFVLEMTTTIATALVAVEIGLRLVNGGISYPAALTVLIITPEFFSPLRQLSLRYHAGAAGKAAAGRIFEVLDTPPSAVQSPLRLSRLARGSTLDFDSIDFSYGDSARRVLLGFSLEIPEGTTLALVGETGTGKSTVADLILGFVQPDRGALTVGGIPIASLELDDWRSRIAWVPQHPHLFHGSVRYNIRLGRPDASESEVIAAAEAAGAGVFISQLPHGYDTQIGENGVRLSGGERQRIAIARAFLKDAPILILDEATSHLDTDAEAVVKESLSRLARGRTVLIIAHRVEFALGADRVVALRDGQAREVTLQAPHHTAERPIPAALVAHEATA